MIAIIIIIILILIIFLSRNIIFTYYFVKSNKLKTGKEFFNFAYIFHDIFIDKEYKTDINLDNKIIFDIGANMGIFSLWINNRYSNTLIYAFEPIKELYEIAEYNFKKMQKNNNKIIINNIGLSNKNTNETIIYYPYANGLSTTKDSVETKIKYHTFFQRLFLPYALRDKESIIIKLEKVSDFIKKNNIKKIDFCKIDVEGSELDVIEGFENFINIVDTFIIEIENFIPDNLNKIKKILINFNIEIKNKNKNWIFLLAFKKNYF